MSRIHSFILIIALLFISLPGNVFAYTKLNINLDPLLVSSGSDFSDVTEVGDDIESSIRNFFDTNSGRLPDAMALANTLGYPNGKSTIKPFPHFEFGLSAGASVTEYSKFGDYDRKNNPATPGIGANFAVHFGTGITDRIDVTFKFFSNFNIAYKGTLDESKDGNTKKAELYDTDVFSAGVKGRYNLVRPVNFAPYVFSFGGVSVNLALDYMKNRFASKVTYSTVETESMDLKFDIFSPTRTTDVEVREDSTGSTVIESNILSVTPEIFAYIDLFYVFSIYTGPSISFNTGTMDFNINAGGELRSENAVTITEGTALTEDQLIGTASLVSENRMSPYWVIPKWTLGLELNISVVKLQFEASADLRHITESARAEVGLRVDI